MPRDSRGWSCSVLRDQAVFFVTGLVYNVLVQQSSYWGSIAPRTFLAPAGLFLAMAICASFHALLLQRNGAPIIIGQPNMGRWIAVALLTLADNSLGIVGIDNMGAMLYNVVYAWLVVSTALIRKCVLKRGLLRRQWVAIIAISCGLSVAGLSGDDAPGGKRIGLFWVGFLATIMGSTFDAIMYIFVESLLSPRPEGVSEVLLEPIGPSGSPLEAHESGMVLRRELGVREVQPCELTLFVGVVDTSLLAGVAWIYGMLGLWKTFFEEEVRNHVGSPCADQFGVAVGEQPGRGLLVSFWALQGFVFYLHYQSFYSLTAGVANAVVAGVSKGAQSVSIFFINAMLFGHCDARQAFTPLKFVSAAAVTVGVVVYSWPKRHEVEPNGET